jgi:hypothetical protein
VTSHWLSPDNQRYFLKKREDDEFLKKRGGHLWGGAQGNGVAFDSSDFSSAVSWTSSGTSVVQDSLEKSKDDNFLKSRGVEGFVGGSQGVAFC